MASKKSTTEFEIVYFGEIDTIPEELKKQTENLFKPKEKDDYACGFVWVSDMGRFGSMNYMRREDLNSVINQGRNFYTEVKDLLEETKNKICQKN